MSNSNDMYGAIVVGTDGSDRAGIALQEALKLAKATGAKLHVVQVLSTGAGFANDYQGQLIVDRIREDAERVRAQVLKDAESGGVSVETHTPDGNPADAIIDVAEATQADLIVVGNRGMTGAKRFVLGSVPNAIAHQAPCSVLIVKTG
ncbi:MAG: universal stress protein [Acidimicrobiales bacterium]